MTDRLRVRFDHSDLESDRLLEAIRENMGCVPIALAAASGRTLGDVFRVIDGRPYARGGWWKCHAAELGLKVKRAFLREDSQDDDVDEMNDLPNGRYLVDSVAHLATLALGPGYVEIAEGADVIRYERGERIPAEALEAAIQVEAQMKMREEFGVRDDGVWLQFYVVE